MKHVWCIEDGTCMSLITFYKPSISRPILHWRFVKCNIQKHGQYTHYDQWKMLWPPIWFHNVNINIHCRIFFFTTSLNIWKNQICKKTLGSGKSFFIKYLTNYLTNQGKRVLILATTSAWRIDFHQQLK